MKNVLLFVITFVIGCWAVPKPMESVANYSMLMVHGAYGSDKGVENCSSDSIEAVKENKYLTTSEEGANIGYYHDKGRLTSWLESIIFEDTTSYDSLNPFSDIRRSQGVPYIYSWRAFTNPANSSINNAHELGDRKWKGCGQRRALVEESQEVKALFVREKDTLYGQVALDSIRKYPDLYRQIPSRYILIGHSMGGIASREWIQNSDYYYGDVDKVITLDSPHEGTGALNAQLNLKDVSRAALEGLGTLGFTVGLTAVTMGKSIPWYWSGIIGMAFSMGLAGGQFGVGYAVASGLEKYHETDSLVCYVDPHGKEKNECKGAGNIMDLKDKKTNSDSMPMFRILAGKHSMTFTDPKLGARNALSFIIPDALTVPFANLYEQLSGGGDERVNYINSVTGFLMGLVSGVNVQAHGSSLVESNNGLAYDTDIFTKYNVDVERGAFNAAAFAKDSSNSKVATILTDVAAGLFCIDLTLNWLAPEAVLGLKAGLGVASAASIATAVYFDVTTGIDDIKKSHTMPLYGKNHKTWFAKEMNAYSRINAGDTSWSPYLMEDFLYERPFVNLALNDSRTMGMLARDSSLNPNCYFESDSLQKVPLCEVGLYGSRDSVVIDPVTMKETHIYNAAVAKTDSAGNAVLDSLGNVVYDSVYYGPFEQRNYSDFRNSPLRFKSESDWYKVGVKVDRWERVDGLKPNGDPAPKGVPIRHVERYSVPDIVVDGFIEKYLFVVDDLMPHRMRQIKMTFNSNEEVAWDWPPSRMLQKMLAFSIAEA